MDIPNLGLKCTKYIPNLSVTTHFKYNPVVLYVFLTAVEQWHHHKVKAARSISSLLTCSNDRYINYWIIQPPTTCNCIFIYLVQGITVIAAWQFEIFFLYSLHEG